MFRNKEYPLVDKFETVQDAEDYCRKLRTTLQQESSERGQDFDILGLANVPWVDIRAYGAGTGKSAADNTTYIHAAIAAMSTGDCLLIPAGTFDITNVIFDAPNDCSMWCLGTLQTSSSGVAITIGDSAGNLKRRYKIDGLKAHNAGTARASGTIGVLLQNLYECNIDIRQSDAFEIGIKVVGNNTGCVYNEIHLGWIYNNKYNLQLDRTGTGWTNENNFYGGRYGWDSGVPEDGFKNIDIEYASSLTNNNKFYSPCVEAANFGYIKKATISFHDNTPSADTIEDSTSLFIAAGFKAGMTIDVTDSASNDGSYTIASVTAGVLTLDVADTLTGEAVGNTVTVDNTNQHIYALYCDGVYNYFYSPRLEVGENVYTIYFDTNSSLNVVFHGLGNWSYVAPAVVDNGSENQIYGNRGIRFKSSAGTTGVLTLQNMTGDVSPALKILDAAGTENTTILGDGNIITTPGLGIKGTGTEVGQIKIYDQDDAEYLSLYSATGEGVVQTGGTSPSFLQLQYTRAQDIRCFAAIEAGNPAFIIAGYKTATGLKYVAINVNSSGYGYIGGEDGLIVAQGGGKVGFYGTTPIALQTGVAVTAAGVHAALVSLGLITS